MTIGHPNAGYTDAVTKHRLALNNPTGARTAFKKSPEELADIKKSAKEVWSAKDNYETTYGRYHGPHKYDKQIYRPSSPERKNNPHPKKVFLTTRMSQIPGCFDDNDFEGRSRAKLKIPEFPNAEHSQILPPSTKHFSNTNEYFQSLHPSETANTENYFKQAGIDTSLNNFDYNTNSAKPSSRHFSYETNNNETKSMFNLHNNSTGDSEYRAEYMGKSSKDEIDARPLKPTAENRLQTNATNPYLYNDYRVYREKYANGDHGVPNPDAKKPSRGEFLIHPDWHARLKHHRLPCNC